MSVLLLLLLLPAVVRTGVYTVELNAKSSTRHRRWPACRVPPVLLSHWRPLIESRRPANSQPHVPWPRVSPAGWIPSPGDGNIWGSVRFILDIVVMYVCVYVRMYVCIRAYRFALIGFQSLGSPSPFRFLTRYRHTAVHPPPQCVPINFENPKIRHRSKQTFASWNDRCESDY